jgi:hypothetical protein
MLCRCLASGALLFLVLISYRARVILWVSRLKWAAFSCKDLLISPYLRLPSSIELWSWNSVFALADADADADAD